MQDALFGLGELAFELLPLGAEFGATFVDVADEVLVGACLFPELGYPGVWRSSPRP